MADSPESQGLPDWANMPVKQEPDDHYNEYDAGSDPAHEMSEIMEDESDGEDQTDWVQHQQRQRYGIKQEDEDSEELNAAANEQVMAEFRDNQQEPASHLTMPPPPNDTAMSTANLQKLLTGSDDAKLLEGGMAAGVELLEDLKGPLKAAKDSKEAPFWLNNISQLQQQAKPTRTVVGVVGNTGAGKSSVINAVLDEERLLPTNCLRACTTSPTEISYNYSEDPNQLYRAKVEFITKEDWIKELHVLYSDFLDGNGEVSREVSNHDSEAGIAYQKVKAVYPAYTKEMVAHSNPEELAHLPKVRGVLGQVKMLNESSAKDLYGLLQRYVDSKEKNAKSDVMEYWPLIKVVRIYTKARALETGAVLVDLPGVQDSNAARAAVAEKYMKECGGLWIVAPITRAVDDKTAKHLLGDTFRRQMKYDGTYNVVTFICSKTDDISITEAVDSLDLNSKVGHMWDQIEILQKQQRELKEQMNDLRDEKSALADTRDECDTKYDTYEELKTKAEEGETVYEPKIFGTPKMIKKTSGGRNKRKLYTKSSKSRKNFRSGDDEDDFEPVNVSDSDDDLSGSDKENSQRSRPEEPRKVLTEEDIDEVLASLKVQKKQIRGATREADLKLGLLHTDLSTLKVKERKLSDQIKSICIKGRNEYSRKAIQQDFAMGIKELDQEAAAEADEANFNPEEDIRDYNEVARSLPVFCVSSRAYQKLKDRLVKDDFQNGGFSTEEDTEVPSLIDHARKITEARRIAAAREFLNDLLRLLNSMYMWAAGDGSVNLTGQQRKAARRDLHIQLVRLESDWDKAVGACTESIKQSLQETIFDSLVRYIPAATAAAVEKATSWGAHRSMGGLFWATYKAICRRHGVFCGAAGPKDFNAELWEPVMIGLAPAWEKAMQRAFPNILDSFAPSARAVLADFHARATAKAAAEGMFACVHMLEQQLGAHKATIDTIPAAMREIVTAQQRDASRAFTPEIQNSMINAYDLCVNECGKSSSSHTLHTLITSSLF
jgi:hypothetical protein